jgi:5-methylthioadenosine/S-adenosylhomocysteine deaminase
VLGGTPLVVGEPADFLLLRASDPELSAGDPDADLVYAASGSVVDTTVVGGRVLMRNREVEGADEIVGAVRSRARRLTGL